MITKLAWAEVFCESVNTGSAKQHDLPFSIIMAVNVPVAQSNSTSS